MFSYAMMTAPGSRAVNEDAVGCFEKAGQQCFVLCDGLGGHGLGDVAAAMARDTFQTVFSQTETLDGFLERAFTAAQERLLAEQRLRNAKHKLKTTAVALATDGRTAHIGHIGDSRLYVFSGGQIVARTCDHSVPQMLAQAGVIGDDEIRHHPDRGTILRALGMEWDEPAYELRQPLYLEQCQAALLCSDGFWELIDEQQMCSLLDSAETADQWLSAMTDAVRRAGAGKDMDNYSAIALWNQRG